MVHPLTVPAAKSVVLLHYVVLSGENTGLASPSTTTRASSVDAALQAIVAGVRSDPQYLDGLTADQIAAVANW
ncbi:MAG TPA: hypothetical protein VLU43_15855 [Anaeromyxobacteraceae bacterium]|nr:hypothetical protein [Anaeromyxobacteraceae bacterium]